MYLKQKLSISTIFFFHMFLITTLSSLVIGLVWVHHEQADFQKQTIKLKSDYLETQKNLVKNTVNNTVNYIHYKKERTRERLKRNVKQRVYEAFGIAENIFQNNSGKIPDSEIIKLIKQALRPVRFFDNRNYYFIDDLEGNSILFPPKPAFEGKNLMGVINKKGVRPFPEIIKLVKDRGEGYFVYHWVKYSEALVPTDEEFPKITYFKLFEPYNWFIAVGEYLDYVEHDIGQEILERVSQIRFKNGDYVNIHTYDGFKLASDGQVHQKPVNEGDILDSKGYHVVREQKKMALKETGGFVYYDINDKMMEKTRSKVSFAMSLPEWKWIISTGTYIDEVDLVIAQKKLVLEKDVKHNFIKIIIIVLGLLLLTLALARYISFKAKSSFKTFSHFFKKASTEDTTIDQKALHFSEFSELAQLANQMIKKRHNAEVMLVESEKKYRHLFENLNDVYYRTDANGIITLISPSVEKSFGYLPDEIIGQKMKDFYLYPMERETFLSQLKKNGSVINFEAQLKRKDNSIIYISTSANLLRDKTDAFIGVEGIARDITEQIQMENDIQALVESTVGIIGPDFFKIIVHKLCQWLDCECAILGEIVGESTIQTLAMELDGEFIDKFSYDLAGAPCENVAEKGFCTFPEGVCEQFPNDMDLAEMKAVGYIGTPIVGSNTEAVGILCAISRSRLNLPKRTKDVINIIATRVSAELERKKLEENQEALQAYFQQAQKMESIGTLAGGIAHDFNNILYPLMGFSEMLKEDLPADSPSQGHVDEILHATLRAKDLVNQILAFSRQGDQDMKPIKLQPIIKEVMKLIRSSIPTTIKIELDINSDCGIIVANSTQIHQIVMNLVTNAYHSMEETGGKLTVGLKKVCLEPEQTLLPGLAPGDYACLIVTDTGIGLENDVADKIFDPYFTTKETGKGTGLGLSVVLGIVKKCNGDIRIDSKVGKGTEFQVYLPVIKQSVKDIKAERNEFIQGGTEEILLVDDEEAIIRMEQQMLERLGYQITACSGSGDALEIFKANPDGFHLVITDMTMPTMTGIQLAGEIKKIRSDIPIILCTGYSHQINDEKSKEFGIEGFVMKPVIKRELAGVIRKILNSSTGD